MRNNQSVPVNGIHSPATTPDFSIINKDSSVIPNPQSVPMAITQNSGSAEKIVAVGTGTHGGQIVGNSNPTRAGWL